MTAMLALGAAEGALLALLVWLLVPHQTSLAVQVARFDARPGRSVSTRDAGGHGDRAGRLPLLPARFQDRVGSQVAVWLAGRGITYQDLRRDLALTGMTFEQVLARKSAGFVAGLLLGVTSAIALRAGHLPVPAFTPAALAIGAGVVLFFLPDVRVHREAVRRRRQFRRALGSWFDLVALEMAASAAPAEALPAAARIGEGWAMILIRETLHRATLSGQDHWQALTDLGSRLGVQELADLATLTRLVGRDGAQVRETLTARASAMRRSLLADSQAEAGRADQSMLVAQILIGFGFVVFVMYPAIMNVMAL